MRPIEHTPWIMHEGIWVKDESQCAPEGAPPFSKLRGVYAHLKSRPEEVIGVLDTIHSKAGWAVAWSARELGKQVINYYPAKIGEDIRPAQLESQKCGAVLARLDPWRSFILYARAKKDLMESYPDRAYYMMPNALKLRESVAETAREVHLNTPPEVLGDDATWVVSISSGTIAAGVLLGLRMLNADPHIFLHCGYSRKETAIRKYLLKMTEFSQLPSKMTIVDEGYAYKDGVKVDVPFPCNEHYDAKAWKWMKENLLATGPIVFWNVGG